MANWNVWVTAILGEGFIIFTIKILMPMIYMFSKTFRGMGAPAAIDLGLIKMLEWGLYCMIIVIPIVAFILDNYKREETGMEF